MIWGHDPLCLALRYSLWIRCFFNLPALVFVMISTRNSGEPYVCDEFSCFVSGTKKDVEFPEFPTIALPVAGILGLMLIRVAGIKSEKSTFNV